MSAGTVHIRAMTAADVDRAMEIADGLAGAPHWARGAWMDALDLGAVHRRIALVAVERVGASATQQNLRNSGEICGFAVASLLPPEGELEVIAVLQAGQRLGLGRQLLGALLEKVRQAGVVALVLEVRASNAAAIGLYRTVGFHQVGSRAGYYADPVEDAVLMRLNLGSVPGREKVPDRE
jgi:ribosomal-protein-alanine N-acetyltransferase